MVRSIPGFQLQNLPTARAELAAGFVNGKLYAVEGFTGTGDSEAVSSALEVYDESTNSWASLHPCLLRGRDWEPHSLMVSSTRLEERTSKRTQLPWRLTTPLAVTGAPVAPMLAGRAFAAVVQSNGYIYAIGGSTNNTGSTNLNEQYSPPVTLYRSSKTEWQVEWPVRI